MSILWAVPLWNAFFATLCKRLSSSYLSSRWVYHSIDCEDKYL